ncbi:MAG: type III pantothenate kinase [Elusimicrobiota bacterium]
MNLLAIDIGNTTVNFGLFEISQDGKNKKLKTKTKILTEKFQKIPPPLNNYDNAIITSVVPNVTNKIISQLKIKPIVLNSKNIPIKIKLKTPEKVGSDRLVNSVAVSELYGVPSVVIDLGTATTLDVISKNREYLGGIIAPGIRISAESLYEKTAKLPKIKPEIPKNVIGKNTKEAILSGIFYGQIGLIKEAINKIENRKSSSKSIACFTCGEEVESKNLKVILTGGYASFFSKYFPDFIIDEDITLKGLEIIFTKIRRTV